MPSSPRRAIAIFLLASLSVVAAASAAPRHATTSADGLKLDLLGLVRTALTFLWASNGCSADPDGRCGTAPAAESDNGCGIDPNGHCTTTQEPEADTGCGIDPFGHCATTPAAPESDAGCHIDPNGHCTSGS